MSRKRHTRATRRRSTRRGVSLGPRRCLLETLEPRLVLAVFTVNTTADTVDANPGDGIAADIEGNTSLRAAIMEANVRGEGAPPMHDIVLPAGHYRLTIADDSDAFGAASGDLDISSRIRILGANAQQTVIDAGGENGIQDRVFFVEPQAALVVLNTTITGGFASENDPDGGAIANAGTVHIEQSVITGNWAAGFGGGLHSVEYVNGAGATVATIVTQSTISRNTAVLGGGGISVDSGSLTLSDSTLSENTAGEDGGAILVGSVSPLELVNVTVSGNVAHGSGGGLLSWGSAVGRLSHATITDNRSDTEGGGIADMSTSGAGLSLGNTIVAANSAGVRDPDLLGDFLSEGGNLIGNLGSASGFVDGVQGDQVGHGDVVIDPLLGPLQDNGGPTWTHLPLSGSPAIDRAFQSLLSFDQRGIERPWDADGDGEAIADVGAVELVPGAIRGVKFHDLDGDGVRASGDLGLTEPGLGGWTIFLDFDGDLELGAQEPFQLTAADGSYAFTGLLPGTYTVVEEPRSGWIPTTPVQHTVTLQEGDALDVDFGNFQLGHIRGYAFRDANANGEDDQEPRLVGVTINLIEAGADRLFDTQDDAAQTVLTGADGLYQFGFLPRGLYRVRQDVPAGWVQTTPDPGDIELLGGQVHVASAAQVDPDEADMSIFVDPHLAFGSVQLLAIRGVKFHDLDGDGVRASGDLGPTEPGLGGWTIFLDFDGDLELGAQEPFQLTAADGSYAFTGLLPGTYTVVEESQSGWIPTTPVQHTVTLQAGDALDVDFGNFQLGHIRGYVFRDANANGEDDQEPRLAGVTINLIEAGADRLFGTEDDAAQTVLTGLDGEYQFGFLPRGLYRVRQDVPAGWVQTTLDPGDIELLGGQVHVASAAQVDPDEAGLSIFVDPHLAFGNVPLPVIRGVKWNDFDGNGVQDPGEPGLPNWTIRLSDASGALLAETWTDEDGRYEFPNLSPGTYNVAEEPRVGYEPTFPSGRFHRATAIPTGTIVSSAVIADLNGDQFNDVVVANDYFNTVNGRSGLTVLLNLGDGQFEDRRDIDLGIGIRPQHVTAADLDGDEDLDLIVASIGDPFFPNAQANALLLLRNQGDGTFAPAQRLAAGNGPLHVVAADLNGDGRVDLVVANFRSDDLSILLGTGDGRFGAAQSIPVGREPLSVAVGDVNGDGFPDIVTAVHGAHEVVVLTGNGSGAFSVRTRLTGFDQPADVQLGDFDGDGRLDLAVANYGTNQVILLRGNGAGVFNERTAIEVGRRPQRIGVGDVDGNGALDVVSANEGDGSVSLLLNDGTGNFTGPIRVGLPPDLSWRSVPQQVALGDLDGDADLDLVVPHFARGITVHFNEPAFHTVTVQLGDAVERDFGNQFVGGGSEPEFLQLDAPRRENHLHNYVAPLDVNGDGFISPLDPLLIINLLNSGAAGAASPDMFPDTDGDGLVVPRDALLVINSMNAQTEERLARPAFVLSESAAQRVAANAVEYWAAAGLAPAAVERLRRVEVRVAELPGDAVGVTRGNVITLDRTAAGYGWNLDTNSAGDVSSANQDNGAQRVDLLTAVMHEMGHVLGLADDAGRRDSLMHARLQPGQRRLPLVAVDTVLRDWD